MSFQPTFIMKEILQQLHKAQIKVLELNDGHSIHVDITAHRDLAREGVYYPGISVSLFDRLSLVSMWDFSSRSDKSELDSTLSDFKFYINSI